MPPKSLLTTYSPLKGNLAFSYSRSVRRTVLVLVLDRSGPFEHEHEHHFIEYEHDYRQRIVGKDKANHSRLANTHWTNYL